MYIQFKVNVLGKGSQIFIWLERDARTSIAYKNIFLKPDLTWWKGGGLGLFLLQLLAPQFVTILKFNLFSEFYCFNNLALYTALSFFYNKPWFPTSQCRHCKSKFSTVLISRRILTKIFKKIYFWKDFSFYVAVVCANFHLSKYIMKE